MAWREEDHDRWPADAPDSRGGQFRPAGGYAVPRIPVIPRKVAGPELWASTASDRLAPRRRMGNDAEGREELRRLVENEEPEFSDEVHGGLSATTRRHTYADGTMVISKVYGAYPEESAKAEVDAALVAEAVGAPAPVVIDGGEGRVGMIGAWKGRRVWMTHITGDIGLHRGSPMSAVDSDDGARIALLDALINNGDRLQNWILTPDGRPVAIDHGEAFRPISALASVYAPTERGAHSASGFVQHHLLGDSIHDGTSLLYAYKPNRFHPDDIRLVRERLAKLHRERGVFNDELWSQAQVWLDGLEKHATGTRRLIT